MCIAATFAGIVCATPVPYRALIVDPVVNATLEPLICYSVTLTYPTLPIDSVKPYNSAICPRFHQLLFHELVVVIEERGQNVSVIVPNIRYATSSDEGLLNRCWIEKKSCIDITTLPNQSDVLQRLPYPIETGCHATVGHLLPVLQLKTSAGRLQEIGVLIEPFCDPATSMVFSVGTRFVIDHIKHSASCCGPCPASRLVSTGSISSCVAYLYRFNPVNRRCERMAVPLHYLYRSQPDGTSGSDHERERIADFVTLLRRWARHQDGYIPYVIGGVSYTQRAHSPYRSSCHVKHTGKCDCLMASIEIPGYQENAVKTGFDCTGLVVRAAQIVGIPYSCKNSKALHSCTSSLKPHEKVEVGDLLLIKGHLMVIAQEHPATLVEARGYKHGYGKVHEILLAKVFKDMVTLEDVYGAYKNRQTLIRLDSQGRRADSFPVFNIIKMGTFFDAQ